MKDLNKLILGVVQGEEKQVEEQTTDSLEAKLTDIITEDLQADAEWKPEEGGPLVSSVDAFKALVTKKW